jgi:RNA polymerase sigma factor (sigma-70 family)
VLRIADDDRLARLAAEGGEQAFAVLYRRHEARMLAVCRYVLRSDDDARDAVQNASIKAFRALQDGQLRGEPRPWLVRIAHNEARSLARARREHALLDPATAAVGADPEAALLAKERLALLAGDVGALPERLRRPLLLRADAGLSYREIGAALGTAPGAARQAVADARSALASDAEAREEDCGAIRAVLAGGDHRRHRSRRIRSHLRGCPACRAWQTARPRPRFVFGPLAGLPVAISQWWSTVFAGGAADAGLATTVKSAVLLVAAASTSATVAATSSSHPATVTRRVQVHATASPHPTPTASAARARPAATASAVRVGPAAAVSAVRARATPAPSVVPVAGRRSARKRARGGGAPRREPSDREGAGRGDDASPRDGASEFAGRAPRDSTGDGGIPAMPPSGSRTVMRFAGRPGEPGGRPAAGTAEEPGGDPDAAGSDTAGISGGREFVTRPPDSGAVSWPRAPSGSAPAAG